MTVAIKYCGGCNPRFDRPAFVQRLAGEHPAVRFVSASSPGPYEGVLVVCGCTAQCALHAHLEPTLGKLVVYSEAQWAAASRWLSDLQNQNER